jgi:NADH:ubiquinone oxidoreductase subunit 4 (subunit M)
VPLAAAALVMGIFPAIFLKPTGPAVEKIVQKVQASQSLRVENSVGQRSNVKGQK